MLSLLLKLVTLDFIITNMSNITPKLIALLLLIALQACHAQKKPCKSASKINKDSTGIVKADTTGEIGWKTGEVDDYLYDELPYWDTTMFHAGGQGYKDTFSVAGTNFRLIHNDTAFDGTLEKLDNGHWIIQWIAQNLGNHNNYDRTLDLNADGYRDFIFYWKWTGEVYLFDPSRKTFADTANCGISVEWEQLDSARNIYYETYVFNLTNGHAVSNLFTFKRLKRVDLLALELEYDKNDEAYTITDGSLTYPHGGDIIKHVKPKEKTDVTEFDYKSFWLKHYKDIPAFKQ